MVDTKLDSTVDVQHKVVNEEDASMYSWYWAMDNYAVGLRIWQLADGSWVALKTYDGTFHVPAGAHDPNPATAGDAVVEGNGLGELHSWYVLAFLSLLGDVSDRALADCGSDARWDHGRRPWDRIQPLSWGQ
jgi:hypothetical protein